MPFTFTPRDHVLMLYLIHYNHVYKPIVLYEIFMILCMMFQISQYGGSPNVFVPTLYPLLI